MDVELQTAKNTEDIGKVIQTVDKLALTMQFEMERGKEEREAIKSMVGELRGISEKMGTLGTLSEKITDLATRVTVLESKDLVCKEWRDKHDGASLMMEKAVKAMWTVCGAGVISVLGFVLYLFFTNAQPTIVRKIGGNTYMGQVVTSDER